MDAVDRADFGYFRRHEASCPGKENNECDAPHVGRLAAHVGAGNDEHAAAVLEAAAVGNEAFERRFDDRMPSLFNADSGMVGENGAHPAVRVGVFGKSRHGIKLGNGFGRGKELRRPFPELRDEIVVERLFERLRAFARGENAVLELLEFGRDEAFAVLKGLLSLIAGGHAVRGGL